VTHAPFIIAAFAIALLTPLVLTVIAVLRRGRARRLLRTIGEEKAAL
jgi:hypothetical protein